MKTTDRLQEVHRQYEAMERAVKRLRELRDEVVRDLLTLRELLHSEAQERRKLVETLRGQWRLVFIVGTIAGFAGSTLNVLAQGLVGLILELAGLVWETLR